MSFEIKCKVCGSTDCVIETVIDYDWDDVPFEDKKIIYCNECGNEQYI